MENVDNQFFQNSEEASGMLLGGMGCDGFGVSLKEGWFIGVDGKTPLRGNRQAL
jgi:hypothetical protein